MIKKMISIIFFTLAEIMLFISIFTVVYQMPSNENVTHYDATYIVSGVFLTIFFIFLALGRAFWKGGKLHKILGWLLLIAGAICLLGTLEIYCYSISPMFKNMPSYKNSHFDLPVLSAYLTAIFLLGLYCIRKN